MFNDIETNDPDQSDDERTIQQIKETTESGIPLVTPGDKRHSGPAVVDQDRTVVELLLTKTRLQNLERMFAVEHDQLMATREKCETLQNVVQRCEQMLAAMALNGITLPNLDAGGRSIDANDL